MSRPEHTAPPEIFYNKQESQKYSFNSRIATIQTEMTERAVELLNLPQECCFLLDIGCGSGLSGEVLEECGHIWAGIDVSESMLNVALERQVEGDLFLSDIGQGVGFRPGTFDGVISISVIQWLCNADKSNHVPRKRLSRFFTTLYSCLKRGARAVFQFYPENPDQVEMIVASATKAGFTGGLVIDYPNSTKAKKYYLCLFTGHSSEEEARSQTVYYLLIQDPQGLCQDQTEPTVIFDSKRARSKGCKRGKKGEESVKKWVLKKKEK